MGKNTKMRKMGTYRGKETMFSRFTALSRFQYVIDIVSFSLASPYFRIFAFSLMLPFLFIAFYFFSMWGTCMLFSPIFFHLAIFSHLSIFTSFNYPYFLRVGPGDSYGLASATIIGIGLEQAKHSSYSLKWGSPITMRTSSR